MGIRLKSGVVWTTVLIFDGVVREEGVVVERFYIVGQKITEVLESGEVGGRWWLYMLVSGADCWRRKNGDELLTYNDVREDKYLYFKMKERMKR
jgi:hypothetical protein